MLGWEGDRTECKGSIFLPLLKTDPSKVETFERKISISPHLSKTVIQTFCKHLFTCFLFVYLYEQQSDAT